MKDGSLAVALFGTQWQLLARALEHSRRFILASSDAVGVPPRASSDRLRHSTGGKSRELERPLVPVLH